MLTQLGHVDEQLKERLKSQKEENRNCLLKIQSISYFSCQRIALHKGKQDEESNFNSSPFSELIFYKFSYLWQSPITVSGEVKAWVIHCIMSLTSSKRTKRSGFSYRTWPWSRLFWLCQLQMPALNTPSVHWEGWSLIAVQPCPTTASIILWHAQFIRSWWRN